MNSSIYSLTYKQLTDWLVTHGQKKFRAKQVWNWLYKRELIPFRKCII
ncbi:ribosomal RNA large subunit methyltransferase N [Gracilibacillus boraciitolerans JCM 21714]|uniref:Ribosomal RNA large subunit methyltransferase N n=1 Tax=Gracilibacillus boraciitolerans JCM 21714 TaxID=1298598 RepID=W4VQG8_9BACI|nr:ribosomal RNA large subunit methyltransferase N [Gracilibacillus boraciitolerans JCM 21714]